MVYCKNLCAIVKTLNYIENIENTIKIEEKQKP
ncbi:hypothetical protein BROSI_A2081 [Candidatus Brocadia sinica JPN1]|uniref:Uncharacterized protein n=1 Tax=Candidatus Brocadia sinica JPN1 TaxID=1197129 RepID=A0ABQ0JXZ1_9BACT|nr:hypothetical protein BROSI_A2081 [Candidatus Brocadia sinica JPN1]